MIAVYNPAAEEGLTANLVMRPTGAVVACNRVFAEMFGFISEDRAKAANVLALLRSRKEGAELLDMVRQQKVVDRYELEMRRTDGEPLYVVARLVGDFDDAGVLTEINVYLFNDTKRKRVEQQLVQGQKMESLGTLAGGIAHDFNNILAIILGYATRLEVAASKPEELPKATRAIKEAVERGATLVQQLLTAAQQSEARFAPLDLNMVVAEAVDMLKSTFPKTVSFRLDLRTGLAPVLGDRSQLHQVLLNLCVNARDAMPAGGEIALETRVATAAEVAEHFTGSEPGDYAALSIRDTGSGMSSDVRPHIFEPFFTTKERGKGTGLGLSVVYGVVNHHRGFIHVDTQPGRGTTFTIYLPVDRSTAARRAPAKAPDGASPRAPQLILLVDDEEMLRELGVTFLEGEGYRVIVAQDGVEAVEQFEKHRDEIGLVLCDLGLPRMGGREAFLRMKQSRPGVRVIVASGYLEPATRSQIMEDGVIDTIQKPYNFHDLVTKVRATIGPPHRDEDELQLF